MEIRVTEVIDVLDEVLGPHLFPCTVESEDVKDPRQCPACENGRLGLKLGRHGGFIGCSNFSKDFGGCKYVRQLSPGGADEASMYGAQGTINAEGYMELGKHPETGYVVTLRAGPYGSYLQMDAALSGSQGKPQKAKRASLPKGMNPADITLEAACDLLKLPQEILKHPEDGEPVMVCNGPFGFYVEHGNTRACLRKGMDPLSLVTSEVLDLLTRKKARDAQKVAAAGKSGSKAAAKKKRAPTAYVVFCQERRKALVAEKPYLNFGEVSKELAAMWHSLGDDEKEELKRKAAAQSQKDQ